MLKLIQHFRSDEHEIDFEDEKILHIIVNSQ